jgi:aspartate/methionine/tyrosine aminotransferase
VPTLTSPRLVVPLAPFALEVWLAERQHATRWDLSTTGLGAFTLAEVLAWGVAPPDWSTLALGYGDLNGSLALRTAIAQRYARPDPAQVMVTQGVLEANLLVMTALLEPGDRVIILTPGYQQFQAWSTYLGAEVILWPLSDTAQFDAEELAPDLAFLQQFNDQPPKLIILNNPHNPTGKVLSVSWLQRVFDWAEEHEVWILCDEVYRYLQPHARHVPLSVADSLQERIIVTDGFSKSVGMPGLRIGWIYGSPECIERCRQIKDYTTISPSRPSELLALWLLQHWDTLWPSFHTRYLSARTQAYVLLHNHFPSLTLNHLQGGAMAWLPCPEPEDLAAKLLHNHGILTVPGSCFGAYPALRFGYGNLHRPTWRDALASTLNILDSSTLS